MIIQCLLHVSRISTHLWHVIYILYDAIKVIKQNSLLSSSLQLYSYVCTCHLIANTVFPATLLQVHLVSSLISLLLLKFGTWMQRNVFFMLKPQTLLVKVSPWVVHSECLVIGKSIFAVLIWSILELSWCRQMDGWSLLVWGIQLTLHAKWMEKNVHVR